MTDLFIGVVSHERSRFADSQGADGLAARLRRALGARGLDVEVQVNTADLHDPAALPIDERTVQASLDAQLRIDREWSAFLGRRGLDETTRLAARWARRQADRVRPPSVATMRRLLNIELSHLDLLRTAVTVGATWALIVEDDASTDDVDDAAGGLAGLIADMDASEQPAYVNVSQSFTNDQLGITHLLREVGVPWRGATERSVLRSTLPVTNTVCAILYRGAFLPTLVAALDAVPVEPVLPIDWKLNRALMDLHGANALRDGDCWLVEPAPIVQRSMH